MLVVKDEQDCFDMKESYCLEVVALFRIVYYILKGKKYLYILIVSWVVQESLCHKNSDLCQTKPLVPMFTSMEMIQDLNITHELSLCITTLCPINHCKNAGMPKEGVGG